MRAQLNLAKSALPQRLNQHIVANGILRLARTRLANGLRGIRVNRKVLRRRDLARGWLAAWGSGVAGWLLLVL